MGFGTLRQASDKDVGVTYGKSGWVQEKSKIRGNRSTEDPD